MTPGYSGRQRSFTIRKGEMRYVFRYTTDREVEALQALLGLASTKDLNLKPRDAHAVIRHLGYNPEEIKLRKEA